MAIIGVGILIRAAIARLTTEIAITDRRIIYKSGLISRRTLEMNVDKVESVDVNQSVFGRLLDYGTVFVRGVGTGIEPLAQIAAPLKFRDTVLSLTAPRPFHRRSRRRGSRARSRPFQKEGFLAIVAP